MNQRKIMIKKYLVDFYNNGYEVIRRLRIEFKYKFEVLSPEETIRKIKETKCSVVRYGDGEFGLITKSNNPDFQQNNDELSMRLAEICICRDPRVLVCIPHNLKTTKDCNEFARKFWEWWIWENDNLEKVAKVLHLNPWRTRVFGDAQITRPYMDWKDKSEAPARFKDLKALWAESDVLIIEGSRTMLGIGNDLLDNAKSVQRLICPEKNAFSVYSQILDSAIERGKSKLVLIALGPTATVLAYDLAMVGIQALDIGHIDIEYEWFKMGATEKVPIEGKAVQEIHVQNQEAFSENEMYLSQIAEIIQ